MRSKNNTHFFFIVVLFVFCFTTTSLYGQKQAILKTTGLGGIFSYGKDIEKERIGTVYVYPETDSTILFFIDVSRGAPSYNMGNLYGRLKVKSGAGIFKKDIIGVEKICSLQFNFKNNILEISTIDYNDNCGFGYGVIADGTYKRRSRKIPDYFISMTGEKHYFKKTDPDKWEGD